MCLIENVCSRRVVLGCTICLTVLSMSIPAQAQDETNEVDEASIGLVARVVDLEKAIERIAALEKKLEDYENVKQELQHAGQEIESLRAKLASFTKWNDDGKLTEIYSPMFASYLGEVPIWLAQSTDRGAFMGLYNQKKDLQLRLFVHNDYLGIDGRPVPSPGSAGEFQYGFDLYYQTAEGGEKIRDEPVRERGVIWADAFKSIKDR